MKRNLAALLILGFFCFLSCGERETKLFNGKDLTGWTFHVQADSTATAEDVFGVKDGVITIAGQPFGYMITDQSFSDYKLHLEWRWPGEPSNSGIFLHAEPIDAVWPRCAEVNLMNGRAGDMIASGGSAFEELKEGRFLRSTVDSAEKPARRRVEHRRNRLQGQLHPGLRERRPDERGPFRPLRRPRRPPVRRRSARDPQRLHHPAERLGKSKR